jgi:hypothetical protein
LAPIATAKLFCNVEPARDPRAITVLWRESVLTRMEFPLRELTDAVLSVNMFVQYIALFAPDVKTWFWGTNDDNDMIHKDEK